VQSTDQHIDCNRQFMYGERPLCKRTVKHLGLHRDARTYRHATVHWGDNECTPEGNQ